jgi:hypothetical protein
VPTRLSEKKWKNERPMLDPTPLFGAQKDFIFITAHRNLRLLKNGNSILNIAA